MKREIFWQYIFNCSYITLAYCQLSCELISWVLLNSQWALFHGTFPNTQRPVILLRIFMIFLRFSKQIKAWKSKQGTIAPPSLLPFNESHKSYQVAFAIRHIQLINETRGRRAALRMIVPFRTYEAAVRKREFGSNSRTLNCWASEYCIPNCSSQFFNASSDSPCTEGEITTILPNELQWGLYILRK